MGRTILLDAKPLSNLLAMLAIGEMLDADQVYYQSTYATLLSLTTETDCRFLSTHAVATEALHFLLDDRQTAAKMKVVGSAPIGLKLGDQTDFNDYGQERTLGLDFADFTLLRAWQSLVDRGVKPYPVTITTDRPLKELAAGKFQQNAYTVQELEGQPGLL